MTTKACLLALNSAMNEIKTVCPTVQSAFMFKKNKQILAHDRDTDELAMNDAIAAFYMLNKKANAHGDINAVTFQSLYSRMVITWVDSFYLAMVVGNEVDEKTLHAISGMVIPTVLRVLDVIHPTFIAEQSDTQAYVDDALQDVTAENPQPDSPAKDAKAGAVPQRPSSSRDVSELLLPEPPVRQFMVESIRGIGRLIGPQDVVFIDRSVIDQWERLYEDREIEEVEVEETRTGKKLLFKFKPLKDSKLDGKGIIQMSEKAQLTLETRKGALVTVKPVISPQEDSDD